MARIVKYICAALGVASALMAAAVASNQILNDDKWVLAWAAWAFGLTLLGLLLTKAWEHNQAAGEQNTEGRSGMPWRMSRRRYRRRVRASAEQMETLGLVTQAEYVLRTRQVYVDVILQPTPVVETTTDRGVGDADSGAVPTSVLSAPTGESSVNEERAVGQRTQLGPLLAKRRVLAVLGAAGSGKTTLARYTALELAEREWRPWRRRFWRRRPLPVLLYLRDHAEVILHGTPEGSTSGLEHAAATARFLRGVVTAVWMGRQLDKGRCVVLLDGLDEVADHDKRKRVVRWVEEQIARYPDNAFVITSRPRGYDDNRLSSAEVLQVQQFTADQIKQFLHAWYQAVERRARRGDRTEINRIAAEFADTLFSRISELPALYDLAANPLLLTMSATVHRYRGQLPASRAALYAEMCQVLLHRRQEDKGVTQPIDTVLSGSQKEHIIQELAWHMMCGHLRDISSSEACDVVRDTLHRAAPDLAPEEFLEHVRRSGLIVEHRHGHYGFVHLTLQEYLAAASVRSDERRRYLHGSVSNPWWRETILLWTVGVDATEVVQACLRARTVHALSLAFACAEPPSTLDPDLRAHLNQLLATIPVDPEEARLLDGVAAARALHDTLPLPTGTRICALPIPADLWNRYTTARDVPPIHPGDRNLGPRTDDIAGLFAWLGEVLPDTPYRLPTPDEARHALTTFHLQHSAFWTSAAAAGDLPALTTRPGHPHPYLPSAQQTARSSYHITSHIGPILFLISFPNAIPLRKLLGHPPPANPTPVEGSFRKAVGLVLLLNLAQAPGRTDLIRALVRDLVSDLVSDLDTARALDRDRVLDRDRDLSQLDLDRARDLARDLADDQARSLDINIDRALDLALVLARDLDRDLARDLDHDLNLILTRIQEHNLVLPRTLARDIARALARDRSLDRALDMVRDLARTMDFSAGRQLDIASTKTLDALLDQHGWAEMDTLTRLGLVLASRELLRRYMKVYGASSWRARAPSVEGFSRRLLMDVAGAVGIGNPADDASAVLSRLARKAPDLLHDFITVIQITTAARLMERARHHPDTLERDYCYASACILAAIARIGGDTPLARELGGVLASLIALVTPEDQPHSSVPPPPSVVLVRA
ncbi:NACHT domain-containing protein [Streptosporangium soli]|nr:NACHT domain-containing protein [Streptosporangium sp. KLBMP 9127]